MEALLIALGEAFLPLIKDAFDKGATREDILKTTEAAMVAASDAEMLRELGPDKTTGAP